MNDFLQMGGYAVYVWTSYALAVVILALNWVLPQRALRSRRLALRRHIRTGVSV